LLVVSWNDQNELTGAAAYSGTYPVYNTEIETVSYAYDPQGRLIDSVVDFSSENRYLYDGENVQEQFGVSGTGQMVLIVAGRAKTSQRGALQNRPMS
jgi:hypothetical protein